ncbi:MAG TPA: PIG-L family deacetylase [Terriglobales bacterium]|nr:PIG-L family deacetylase [Terriglobales bacterium]
MLARRVPLLVLTTFFSVALWSQTNTAAGAGTYPAQPQPNSTANLGVRPEVLPWDTGEAGLHLLAKKLKNTGRIMHLTAHPDDEDGALLTYLARGQGRQVLLMSLTRGEGGQNRTGSNLWDELGVLRTLELLESTRYYGTELRFSRVADFGFSKSADETFQKWGGHQVPLRDIVYVIREWKPDVLFTRFSGTPRDGHGMHQASAILAPEAVKCAADPGCFPDQLKGDHALTTWQVLKLYMGNQGGDYTVRYDVSQIDPDTKLSYTQMALEGFKHQASQLSGNFSPPSGPNWRSYKLVYSALAKQPAPGEHEQDFFDGIAADLRYVAWHLADQQSAAPWMQAESTEISKLVDEMQSGKPFSQAKASWRCGLILEELEKSKLRADVKSSLKLRFQALSDELEIVKRPLYHFDLSVVSDKGRPVIRGETFTLRLNLKNDSGTMFRVKAFTTSWRQPDGAFSRTTFGLRELPGSQDRPLSYSVTVPKEQLYTRPHWHRSDPERDTTYSIVGPERFATHPLQRSTLVTATLFDHNNLDIPFSTLAMQREDGKAVSLSVVPAVSLLFSQSSTVLSAMTREADFSVHVRSTTGKPITASVDIKTPSGWSVVTKPPQVQFAGQGDEKEARFRLHIPEGAKGNYSVSAIAMAGGEAFSEGFSVVSRPDLDTFYYYQPAIQRVSIVDVNVPKSLRVGYIPGAGDDIFPVLQQLGLNARQISNDELAKGDLYQ